MKEGSSVGFCNACPTMLPSKVAADRVLELLPWQKKYDTVTAPGIQVSTGEMMERSWADLEAPWSPQLR